MKSFGTLFLAFALFAVPAAAQSTYVVTSSQQAYVPLTNATALTFSSLDDSSTTIPLNFTFPYYGQPVTTVGVSTNGMIMLTTPTSCTSGCTTGGAIPSTSRTPHGLIAPWWRDLKGSTSGSVRYVQTSTSIVIEFSDWGYYSAGTPAFSFQVQLDSSGVIAVHYGSHSSTITATSVTNGWEDGAGTAGGNLIACGSSGSCTDQNWPANTRFTIAQPVQPELSVATVALSGMVKTGSDLAFNVSPTFQNVGQTAANNFHWKAYLSTDRVKSTDDQLVFDSSVAGQDVSLAPTSNATVTGVAAATNVTAGNYYVLVEADSTNVVTEFSENNNLGSTSNYFTVGVDLVAAAISGPSQIGPGSTINVLLNWFNQGTDPAPTPGNVVKYRLVLSADRTLDSSDFTRLFSGTEVVTGAATFNNRQISVVVPDDVPGGDYYLGLEVDSDGQVPETLENNNVVFAAGTTRVVQADLTPLSVELLDPYTRAPTRSGLLGERGRIRVTYANVGGADAKNFKIGVVLSTDANLSLLNDPVIHDEPVALVATGATVTAEFDFTFPLTNRLGQPYKTGGYYVFVILDSFQTQTELNDDNNSIALGKDGVVDQVFLHTPASDYAVLNLQAPSTGAVGELVPVSRIIRNGGNLAGKTVSYRFYLSANSIIDPADQALRIIGPTGAPLDDGQLTLAAGATDSRTELVEIPAGLQPGTWYVGLIVDLGNVDAELDESNNAVASATPLQLTASSLVINNQQLPDAVAELPYSFKLSASSGDEPVQWTILEGDKPGSMDFSTDGVLSGAPASPGVFTFLVEAKTDTRTVAKWLVLRVLAGPDQLVVTTTGLPPVINNPQKSYEAQLAAAGGVKDYSWSLISGVLPNGLTLSTSGKLSGSVRSGVKNGPTDLVLEVTDALGTRARAKLTITVVAPGALQIQTVALPDSMVDRDYSADLVAANSDGTPLSAPLAWSIVSGRLPQGMALSAYSPSKGLLSGKALETGTFAFTLQVIDKDGRMDTTDLVFTVHPAILELTAVNAPGAINPGAAVDMQVTTGNTASTYRLYAGALPPGVTLAVDGKISGTIEESDSSVRTWNFVVEAQTPNVGASLAPFAIEVVPAPVAQGCDSAPTSSPFGVLAMLAVAAAFALRRRGVRAG